MSDGRSLAVIAKGSQHKFLHSLEWLRLGINHSQFDFRIRNALSLLVMFGITGLISKEYKSMCATN